MAYLFKQERHLLGKVLIRKRERSDLIYFVLKGEIDVRFPHTQYDLDAETQHMNDDEKARHAEEHQGEDNIEANDFLFARIKEGGYFNLSSALLKKFSIFEF